MAYWAGLTIIILYQTLQVLACSTINYKELWEILLHGFEPINFKFKIYDDNILHFLHRRIEYASRLSMFSWFPFSTLTIMIVKSINELHFKTLDY